MAWATADEPIRPDTALDLSPARRAVDGLARAGQRIPGSGLFLIGAFSQYVGTAIAVTLFAVIPAPSVAWARLTVAALILTAWRRPWRLRWPARRWALAVGFGLALASMNVLFYLAIDRLPLGTAVAIEFSGRAGGRRGGCPPVAGRRRCRAGHRRGVLLLADVSWAGSALGVVFALGAGTMWAGYIVLGSRVAAAGDGVDGLAVGLLAGAVAMAPLLAAGALPAIQDGWLLAACACVGLLSTAVPYALDQIVFRRVGRARFALLQSMLPATAAVVGVLVLRQIPSPPELVGVALVVLAVATSASGRTE
ncbi:EamA family transporter [Fodinicola feengrottensis]|uniref:EamA family transporter n=1 Tax=Fodinicola feengrottensis TaxID=435914 RepID=UPI0013D37D40|nr:EamA family transporter [Fodinicola feengrottensis]